jgi:hypothetical protein
MIEFIAIKAHQSMDITTRNFKLVDFRERAMFPAGVFAL